MQQKEFWDRLQLRVTSEIEGLHDENFLSWRCESFVPIRLGLVGDRQAVIGTVRMIHEKGQSTWHFALILIQIVASMEEIEWKQLLPTVHVTGWLSLNALKKEMKIDQAAAFPDPMDESET